MKNTTHTPLLAGLLLGAAQQLRGAHFMSHTLWTGWICWSVAVLLELARCTLASTPAPVLDLGGE